MNPRPGAEDKAERTYDGILVFGASGEGCCDPHYGRRWAFRKIELHYCQVSAQAYLYRALPCWR